MKSQRKKLIIKVIIIFLLLFTPIPIGSYDDGGTTDYFALTYRIVDWKCIVNEADIAPEDRENVKNGKYTNTCVYMFPLNFLPVDMLWDLWH